MSKEHYERYKKYYAAYQKANQKRITERKRLWCERTKEVRNAAWREYCKRPEVVSRRRGYARSYRHRNPERVASGRLVRWLVKCGRLRRPRICSKCRKRGRVYAHHEDYAKPLEVVWVCPFCHGVIHRVFE